MELPALDAKVDWRRSGFNRVLNGGFEAGTTGWSVGAGINASGTSLAQAAAAALSGNYGLRVVCSGANSSGANYVLPGTFKAGRPYIARFPVRQFSGTTAAKATLGSLGTPADRATTTVTLAGLYSENFVSVAWTPSADRADAQLAVMANAAAALTFEVDHVEVYEAINDIAADLRSVGGGTGLTWDSGANFDGTAEPPGTAMLIVDNVEGKYDKKNAASPLYGLLKPKRRIHVRALYIPTGYAAGNTVMYGCFAGVIRNIVPRPGTDLAEILCQDMLWLLKKTPYSKSGADNLSYSQVRDIALADAGFAASQTSYPTGGPESSKFYSFAPRAPMLDYLAKLNEANGSMHAIVPSADLDTLFRYTVHDRREAIDGSVSGIAEQFTWAANDQLGQGVRNYDDSDENIQNIKRVRPHPIAQRGIFDQYWRTSQSTVPFTVPAGESSDGFYVDFSKEVPPYKPANGDIPAVGEYTFPPGRGFYMSGISVRVNGSFTLVTGARSIDVVEHPKAVYFEITAIGSPFTVTSLEVWGTKAVEDEERAGFRTVQNAASIAEHDKARGSDIDNPYIPDGKRAKALAKYWTDRYANPRARFELVVQNRFPSQLVRQIGERVNVTQISDELHLNGVPAVIRGKSTVVSHAGNVWETVFRCEEIPDTTPAAFVIGTSIIGGPDAIF